MSRARENADGGVKAGTLAFFGASTAPTGWIKANGAAISRSTYANLFAAIGTTFGSGDGSTTFNVPDMRGEFPRGLDDGRGIDSGRTIGSAQGGANELHTHEMTSAPHTGGYQYGSGRVALSRGYPIGLGGPYSHVVNASGDGLMATGVVVNSNSGGSESRPRNVAFLACIKF